MSWRSLSAGRRAMAQRKVATRRRVCAVAVAALSLPAAAADPAAACAAEQDDRARLACYDKLFRPGDTPPAEATPSSVAPAGEAPVAPPLSKAAAAEGTPASAMSRLWELDRAHKHGTFLVKTYLPNFVLPLHVSSQPTAMIARVSKCRISRPTSTIASMVPTPRGAVTSPVVSTG